jgi:hypothetical protein
MELSQIVLHFPAEFIIKKFDNCFLKSAASLQMLVLLFTSRVVLLELQNESEMFGSSVSKVT